MKPIAIECIQCSIQILHYADFFKNAKIQGVDDENLEVVFDLARRIQINMHPEIKLQNDAETEIKEGV
jgi:hypothetical protein